MSQRILIIGNSDGIGAALTQQLISGPAHVVGISRSPSPLGAQGPRHEVMDVTSPDYPGFLQRVLDEEGPFDSCVFCPAIGSALTLPDCSNEARVFDVNLVAMVRTFSRLLPDWIRTRRGHFVGLSSLADDFYNVAAPSYSASKAAFSNYLVAMGLKLRPYGVHTTNIRFGFVDTKLPTSRWKPLMMTPECAAEHIVRCLHTQPLQLSVPKLAGAMVAGRRWMQSIRVWMS